MNRIQTVVLATVAAMSMPAWPQGLSQVWKDDGADNVWSTNEVSLNWDAGAAWTNGNSALFRGGEGTVFGETVDVLATVTVANVTFQTNGYVIADAEGDGLFLLAGAPSIVSVVNAGDTATVSRVVGGSGGLAKAGTGLLNLTTNNAYSGTTTVSEGVLRLARGNLMALGATGSGNDTVVAAGATLDFNGCYVNSGTAEKFTISGTGADGNGALVNKGSDMTNRDLSELILQDNATVGGPGRIDFATVTGNGKTFTKTGTLQMCVKNLVNATVVINQGMYTLLGDNRALGGSTPGDTTVNGGTLNAWNTMTVSERIMFNGGAVAQGNISNTFVLAGHLTVNSNVLANSGSSRGVEITGYVDGQGGFTQQGAGWLTLAGNTNAYTGPTTVNSGCPLWVGRPGTSNGAWGPGVVTNYGRTYFYSGRFGSGAIVNNGGVWPDTNGLYFDRPGAVTFTNQVSGYGTTYVRYQSEPVLSGNSFSNGTLRVVDGALTLTNGASLIVTADLTLADRQYANYTNSVLNFPVTGIVTVTEGSWVTARDIVIGNGGTISNGLLVGTVNQYGGVVRTYGATAESNGVRVGHYPLGYGTYNMRGGTLIVDNGWDLCIATDGTGWVHQTGGEIYASRVMLNERVGGGGFGRLTVAGGVLNIGLTNGITNVVANGISVDSGAPYLLEFGGAGGVVRAVTNFVSALDATLYGSNASAITFDTQEWSVSLSGKLAGAGGLNKAGSGTLTVTGANTYSGGTAVAEGTLRVNARSALPSGALTFGTTANGTCGVLHATGDLSLEGLAVGFVNPEAANTHVNYTVITCDGALTGALNVDSLPGYWYTYYDRENGLVQLRASVGTVLWLR